MRAPLRRLPLNGPRALGLRHCSTSSKAPTTPASEAQANASEPRLRFAPSPTGFLHLGGLRTALFNYLLARKWGGRLLLRIEDTDQSRLVPGAVDALRRTFDWAGIEYDEGPGIGGYGPYVQSERLDLYREAAEKLIETDNAYECFCTPDELAAIRVSLAKKGRLGYDGRCRHLSRDDVRTRKEAGHPYTIRFKSKQEKETLPDDLVFGAAQPNVTGTGADDFIMMKTDGWPTYHLASVVDDHAMRISHVLRGEEWLPSVTKHHQLYRAFGWSPPAFAHLPLLVNADGTKLSKRTGDVHVERYAERGYEPEAMLNFLALLGWDYHSAKREGAMKELEEVFSLTELVDAFDVGGITHRRAAVSLSKLDYINRMTLRRKATSPAPKEEGRASLVARFHADLRAEPTLAASPLVEDTEYVGRVFDMELERVTRLNEMPDAAAVYFLDPDYAAEGPRAMKAKLKQDAYTDSVSTVIEQLEGRGELTTQGAWDAIHATFNKLAYKKKEITMSLRHALTGRPQGPTVAEIMSVLGRERSLARLRTALAE
ncbi:glutamyl-tRNA synthetase [Cutaneotrichosporon oleaginosum]|uniref:Glutamate--tRNA ligase, mitochondrial n=1 Tax=Cutaneotrichosporon oleaginosum TaxID=879819 RepID=A0A0J0XNX6_9TREE|nr:glutamyl-tRNA synthetase [Cutaneotrichosporon oleaginosum]KLT42798.1 glutamyl-tRNA synthetase [Cutaneotrichosporon oleaginosum]TXT08234.1 hypothetical protein COLE_05158 [Cutaneotrichosporon oleaginosum]